MILSGQQILAVLVHSFFNELWRQSMVRSDNTNLNVPLGSASENTEILGKQNWLFPEGPVIKWLLFYNFRLDVAFFVRVASDQPSFVSIVYGRDGNKRALHLSWNISIILANVYIWGWKCSAVLYFYDPVLDFQKPEFLMILFIWAINLARCWEQSFLEKNK